MVAAIHAERLDEIQYMILLNLNNRNTLDVGLEEINEKKNPLICVYVLMYIGLPTLAFLFL